MQHFSRVRTGFPRSFQFRLLCGALILTSMKLSSTGAAAVEPLTTETAGGDRGGAVVGRIGDEEEKTQFVSLSTGAGFGTFIFGGRMKHDFAFVNLQYGRAISDSIGKGIWTGRWYFLGELTVGREFHPGDAWAFSLTPLLRYQFESSEIVVPFIEGGYGITWTDLREPDLGGYGQFNGYFGAGVSWFVAPNVAWSFQYRFIHYSNAGLRDPNSGVNLHCGLTGISYFF